MSARQSRRYAAPGLALSLGVSLFATGVAIPALGGGDSAAAAPARDITLHEHATAVKIIHSKPSDRGARLRTGDRLVVRLALFTEQNQPSGTLFVACTNVGHPAKVFKATASCQATYRFADGDIVAQGVLRPGAAGEHLAIVGGTKTYAGVQGEVETAQPAGRYDVDVLHLTA